MTRREALKLLGLGFLILKFGGSGSVWAAAADFESVPERVKGSQIMMGNVPVSISVVSFDRNQGRKAIEAAFFEMRRLEKLMSIFQPDSQISQINRMAGNRPVRVNPEVLTVIQKGREMAALTDGAFDIALGPVVKRWDFLGEKHVPTSREIGEMRDLCRPEDILIDPEKREVFLKKTGMILDLGGIGKGYMTDEAKRVLLDHGISSGIIAAAGDLVVFGTKHDGTAWRVGIQHPRKKGEMIAYLKLTDCAVSTSGDYERFFEKDGVIYHHILDPQTFFPARDCRSVTVISPDGLTSDPVATGSFVMGPEKGITLLRKAGNWDGIIVDGHGEIFVTDGLESRIQWV